MSHHILHYGHLDLPRTPRAQLTLFNRLDDRLRWESQRRLDKFYAFDDYLCDNHLYAVVSSNHKLNALLLLDIEYATATVLWGSLVYAFRALMNSNLAKSKLASDTGDTTVRVFWKESREFIDFDSRTYGSLTVSKLSISTEEVVVTDVPASGRPWHLGNGAWASVHPSRTHAALFRVPPCYRTCPRDLTEKVEAKVDACMIEEHQKENIDIDAWQACDVTIARDSQHMYLFFRAPLVLWSTTDKRLDDVLLLFRGWTDYSLDDTPPRANKAWKYFDSSKYVRTGKTRKNWQQPWYFQLRFDDALYWGSSYLTKSIDCTFACLGAMVVESSPAVMENDRYLSCYQPEWSALRKVLLGIEFRVAHGARVIQRAWRRCIADPAYLVCRRRLKREFECDLTGSDGRS